MRFFIYFLLVSISCFSQSSTKRISGRIQLDDTWGRAIYLSYIPSFNELYALSNEMIISGVKIDSTGYFSLDIDFLPKENHLFRLHVVKKESPISSLIIGGKEQNHIFIIVNNTSNIFIEGKGVLFNDISIKGSLPNVLIQQIDRVSNTADSISIDATALQRKFSTGKVYQKLKNIADTTNYPLVSLHALYKSRFQTDYPNNKEFYFNYNKKWKNQKNIYFETFRKELSLEKKNEVYLYIFLGIILIGSISYNFYRKRKRRPQEQLKLLSIQERKVFNLLKEGKSNKEISQELNIGLNTVKTHVSNVYSKLSINSRKEALEFVV